MKEIFLLGFNEEKEFGDFMKEMEQKFNLKIRWSGSTVPQQKGKGEISRRLTFMSTQLPAGRNGAGHGGRALQVQGEDPGR